MPNFDEKGLRKAAILLMSMPTKNAAQVLGQLPPSYSEAVSIMIAQIDSVGGDDQEIVIADFLTSKASSLYASPGGLERAKELIKEALGRDAGELIGNLQQTIEAMPFSFIKKVEPQTLLQFIGDEHPQTIALMLSHFPSNYAAEVIAGLGPENQQEDKLGRNELAVLDARNRRDIEAYIKNIETMEQLTRVNTNLRLLRMHQEQNMEAPKRTVTVELIGCRISDFVLTSFPGELTVQIGLNLKAKSSHQNTFIAGYTNGYIYYAPTSKQLENVGGAQEDSDCILAPHWQALYEQKALEILGRL